MPRKKKPRAFDRRMTGGAYVRGKTARNTTARIQRAHATAMAKKCKRLESLIKALGSALRAYADESNWKRGKRPTGNYEWYDGGMNGWTFAQAAFDDPDEYVEGGAHA